MTRNAIILVLICALAGVIFYFWKEHEARELEKGWTVVWYSFRDIPEGTRITADIIERREMMRAEIPKDAVAKPFGAGEQWKGPIGYYASHRIPFGKLICSSDLAEIRRSKTITKEMLEP